ncbi:MAG: hypothetical protein F6K21_35105, partial [Symploca sp. SIO2D2]|nr:hypothetical protein [Symploca sp. SIO2D2]
ANQGSTANQQFDIDPDSSFKTVQCANGKFWKYFPASGEIKLVGIPPSGDASKFKVAFNSTSNDYEIFCKAVNNGNTRLTVAGAYEFDLQNV